MISSSSPAPAGKQLFGSDQKEAVSLEMSENIVGTGLKHPDGGVKIVVNGPGVTPDGGDDIDDILV